MKNFINILYIKLTLLRISLFKNTAVFGFILLIIIAGFTVAGDINEDTPILGWLLGGLSQSFALMWSTKNFDCNDVVSIVTPMISILLSIMLFITRFKKIGLTDIKSRKIKIMIIRNGLVLNNAGFLVKKEKYKASEDTTDTSVNIITDTASAISELGNIITSNVDVTSTDDEILASQNSIKVDEVSNTKTKKSIWKKIGIVIADIINIFKDDDINEDYEESTETTETKISTEQKEEIKIDETTNNDTVEIIETATDTGLILETQTDTNEKMADKIDEKDAKIEEQINNINEKIPEAATAIKTTVSLTKTKKSANNSSAADLLAKLNNNKK